MTPTQLLLSKVMITASGICGSPFPSMLRIVDPPRLHSRLATFPRNGATGVYEHDQRQVGVTGPMTSRQRVACASESKDPAQRSLNRSPAVRILCQPFAGQWRDIVPLAL